MLHLITNAYDMMMTIPTLLVVAFALVDNIGRFEGWLIVVPGMIIAYYLKEKWLHGGQRAINTSLLFLNH